MAQILALKKENIKASVYAKKTIQELFQEEVVSNTIVRKANISESVIAINEGNGKFTIKKLPPQVQFSCICGITCTDVNNDGNTDLILAGNNFEFKPQFSRLDANYGNVLLGDGKGSFDWQNYDKSGFFIQNEVKHVQLFKDKNGASFVVAAINDQQPKIYKLDEK